MKNKELIEKLQAMPKDADVFLMDTRIAPNGHEGYFNLEVSQEVVTHFDDDEDENGNQPEYPAVCISFESEEE